MSDCGYFEIKNWDKFQHYNKRTPPWIKLHRALLTDYEFTCLQDASKLLAILCWLLASQLDNKVPADPEWLRRQLSVKQKPDLKALHDAGFIVLDSKALACCKQSASAETETEAETEKHMAKFDQFWKLYPRKEKKVKAKSAFLNLSPKNQDMAIKDVAHRFDGVQRQFIPMPTSYINAKRWDDENSTPDDFSNYNTGNFILRCNF